MYKRQTQPDVDPLVEMSARAMNRLFPARAAQVQAAKDWERAKHRAAVLREAAELGRQLSRDGFSAQEIAARLDRMADEESSR